MNQEATKQGLTVPNITVCIYQHHASSYFSLLAFDSSNWEGIIKFLANKPSRTSRVYLTKARYMSNDHMYREVCILMGSCSIYLFQSEKPLQSRGQDLIARHVEEG